MKKLNETKPVKSTSSGSSALKVTPLPKRIVFNTCRLPSNCH